MIVNGSNLANLMRAFRVIYQETLQGRTPRVDRIATVIPSTTASQDFPIGGLLASIREWIGDRHVQNIAAWTQQVRNKSFEGTVGVPREAIEDDQVGVYKPSIQQLAVDAEDYPFILSMIALMVNSFTVAGFDGVPFFSASHKWEAKKAAQSNLVTTALASAAVYAGIKAMAEFKKPNGDVLRIVPDTFVCGQTLQSTVDTLFLAPTLANGASNPHFGRFKRENIIIDPLITSATAWAMFDFSRPIKPVIYQERKKPEFVAMDKVDDEAVFTKKEFRYGVDFRGAAAAIAWWLGYGSTGAGA